MTCPDCAIAEQKPDTGHYSGDCINCQARAIAQGPEAHRREADPQAIQGVMRRVWPNREDYAKGRTLVWAWIKRLEKELHERT